jgi:hypothetical protein
MGERKIVRGERGDQWERGRLYHIDTSKSLHELMVGESEY